MRILIVQTSFLGDVVLTTPLMVSLKESYPECSFSWVTTPEAAPILRNDPWIEHVITFDKNRSERSLRALFSKAKEISTYKFDRVYGVQRSWRTALLLSLSGIPERIGFTESRLSFLYSETRSRNSTVKHEVLRNLALLGDSQHRALRVIPAAKDRFISPDGREFDPSRSVVIGVGSAWATKRWTLGGFVAVAKMIVDRGLTPVLLGGQADQARAEIVAEEVPQAINLACGLDESISLVNQCAAVVCHDSLLLHLASAFGKPTVAIFCSTVPDFGFGPWINPLAKIVQETELSCKPCGRHGHQYCPTGTWACSRLVTPDMVIHALDSVMTITPTCGALR